MNVKRAIFATTGIVVTVLGLWMGLKPDDWRTWLGFSSQATYNYAFVSGVGPMLLTALGMGSIVVALWRSVNCHEDGCWNIGRHKVNGTPWCDLHHDQARHIKTTEQLLTETNDLLRQLLDRMPEAA